MDKEKRKGFLLRIDPNLCKELEHWAADDLRSLNGQIEYLLREAVRNKRRKLLPDPADDQAPQS
ncbi:MAG: hypothetical protein JW706_10550 [Opitutales bacterium]|nr:hypothetical protein [Opitutales bacterium]